MSDVVNPADPIIDLNVDTGPLPVLGQIVMYRQGDYECSTEGGGTGTEGTNGTRIHPAIVTRVWSSSRVNLYVFMDGQTVQARNTVDQTPDDLAVLSGRSSWELAEVADTTTVVARKRKAKEVAPE